MPEGFHLRRDWLPGNDSDLKISNIQVLVMMTTALVLLTRTLSTFCI